MRAQINVRHSAADMAHCRYGSAPLPQCCGMTQLIAVFGASPGIGKSTLSRRIATDAPAGARVDRFDEENILSRPEFESVAAQFQATGVVSLDVVLDASARFVASPLTYDIVVTDTLFPFVPSLLAWGHDEGTIQSFLAQLHTILQPLHPVVVYLDGEPADALPRAASRSGEPWLHAFLAKVSTYKTEPPLRGLDDTVAYLRYERDVTPRTMIDTGYVVIVLRDAHIRSPDDIAAEARQRLAALA
jgi:hypothetical protein